MFSKNKKLVTTFVFGSIAVIILSLLFKNSIGYLLTIFSVVLAFVYLKYSTKENVVSVQEIKPDNNADFSIECIVNINTQLRMYCYNKEYIAKVEYILDNLIEMVLLVNKKDNYSDNTPLVNRIATTYLPGLINSFISLSKEEQLGVKTFNGLNSINIAIDNARRSIELQNISEFNKQVNFMKSFFEGDYSNENNNKGEVK